MARETDTSTIANGFRNFIATREWEDGEMRQFYFTGYEKVEKTSKNGKLYSQYYVYLLPLEPNGTLGEELTLGLFPNQVMGLKGIQNYQQVNITKELVPVEGRDFDQENYNIVGVDDILKEKDRPEVVVYSEVRPAQITLPASYPKSDGEIDISDIPF